MKLLQLILILTLLNSCEGGNSSNSAKTESESTKDSTSVNSKQFYALYDTLLPSIYLTNNNPHLYSLIASDEYMLSDDKSYLKWPTFITYAINELIKNNISHVTDYALLQKIKESNRTKLSVAYFDTIGDGSVIEIHLQQQLFKPENHNITYLEYGPVDIVDGQKAWYGDSIPKYPLHEIKSLEIKINGENILIPKESYSNLYDLNLSKPIWNFGTDFYASKDGKLIFLYIGGGSVSGTYFAKLIFNRSEYESRYIVDYQILSNYGCFFDEFKGI